MLHQTSFVLHAERESETDLPVMPLLQLMVLFFISFESFVIFVVIAFTCITFFIITFSPIYWLNSHLKSLFHRRSKLFSLLNRSILWRSGMVCNRGMPNKAQKYNWNHSLPFGSMVKKSSFILVTKITFQCTRKFKMRLYTFKHVPRHQSNTLNTLT